MKRLNSFAWNLHLEMTCLLLRLLAFCFHIPFSPSVTKPGSISICNWQTMVDVQRHLSIKGLFLSYTWPQERGAFVGKKTSAMIMSLNICYFYSHTFLQARGKDKRNRFYLIFFNPSWRVVLKRNRMFFSIVSFLEILIQENRGLK